MSFVRLLLALSTITAMTAPSSASRPPAHSTTPWTLEIERFQHDHAAGGPVHAVTCTLRGRAATTIRCDEGTSITLDPVESAWFRDAVQAVDWRATPPARADVGGWRLRHRRPGVRAALTVYDATDVAPAVDRVIREMQAAIELRRRNAMGGQCGPDTYLDACPAPAPVGPGQMVFAVCGPPTCVPRRPAGSSCQADWQCQGRPGRAARCAAQRMDEGLARICE